MTDEKKEESIKPDSSTETATAKGIPHLMLSAAVGTSLGIVGGIGTALVTQSSDEKTIINTPTAQVAQLPDSNNFSHEANEAEGAKRIKEIIEEKKAKETARKKDNADVGGLLGGGVGLLVGTGVGINMIRKSKQTNPETQTRG